MTEEGTEKAPILVPVDFSSCSRVALDWAIELAEALHAPLTVLHVVHDPGEAPGYYRVQGRENQLRTLEDLASEMLTAFLREAGERHPHSRVLEAAKHQLVVGLPVSRTLEVVERIAPRMLVMGSAGRTGLSHLLLGSKAEQLVRLCPAPVVIVKDPEARPACGRE